MTATGADQSPSPRGQQSGIFGESFEAKAPRRNAQATRERILDAAFTEFAGAGLAGARIDRIAARAKCNKSLIFVYFENKAALFEAVVGKELGRIDSEVGPSTKDALELAAELFDFAMGNPNSMRLLAWYRLEAEAAWQSKATMLPFKQNAELAAGSRARHTEDPLPANFLPAAIIALSTAWSQANLIGHVLTSSGDHNPAHLREMVLEGVRRLTK